MQEVHLEPHNGLKPLSVCFETLSGLRDKRSKLKQQTNYELDSGTYVDNHTNTVRY